MSTHPSHIYIVMIDSKIIIIIITIVTWGARVVDIHLNVPLAYLNVSWVYLKVSWSILEHPRAHAFWTFVLLRVAVELQKGVPWSILVYLRVCSRSGKLWL